MKRLKRLHQRRTESPCPLSSGHQTSGRLALQFVPGRDPHICWTGWYLRPQGTLEPVSSREFQVGLSQRFSKRDGMYSCRIRWPNTTAGRCSPVSHNSFRRCSSLRRSVRHPTAPFVSQGKAADLLRHQLAVHTEKVAKGTTCFRKAQRRRVRQTVMLRGPRFRNPSWKDQGRGTDHRQGHARYASARRDAQPDQAEDKSEPVFARRSPWRLNAPLQDDRFDPALFHLSFPGQAGSVYKTPRSTGAWVRRKRRRGTKRTPLTRMGGESIIEYIFNNIEALPVREGCSGCRRF